MGTNNKNKDKNLKLNSEKKYDKEKNNEKIIENIVDKNLLLNNSTENSRNPKNILKNKNIEKDKQFLNFLKIEKNFTNQLSELKKKLLSNKKDNNIKFEIKYFIKQNQNQIQNLKELYKRELKSESNILKTLSLHKAIKKKDYNQIRNLLLSNQNPNETNFEGNTPLYISIINEDKKLTKILTEFQAELLWSEIPKKTLTQYAIESDLNSLKLKLHLNKNLINSTSFSETFKTALSSAVYFKKLESVELLLKNGADPNVRDNKDKIAIHFAYRIGLKCYQILLENNSELEISDKEGFFPVHYACAFGDKKILEFFIENNCDLRRKNLKGDNGVFLAAAEGNIDVVRGLLNYGIDVNCLNFSKQSALHYSVINEKFEMTSFLLENGAFTNFRDINGKTALDYSNKVSNHKISNLIKKWK